MAKGFLWLLILCQISSRDGLHLFANKQEMREHCRLICLQLLFKQKNRDKLSTVKDIKDNG